MNLDPETLAARQLWWVNTATISPETLQSQLHSLTQHLTTENILLVSQTTALLKRLNLPSTIEQLNYKQTQAALGTQYSLIIFDAEQGFTLDAFLRVNHTLVAGGHCILFFKYTAHIPVIDQETPRFVGRLTTSPRFNQFLHLALIRYATPLDDHCLLNIPKQAADCLPSLDHTQQNIFNTLSQHNTGHFLLTGKRGTGKTLVTQILSQHLPTYLCHAYLSRHTWHPNRIAPDALLSALSQYTFPIDNTLLIIEEAASLSLAQLLTIMQTCPWVLLVTTTDNYEGTALSLVHKLPQHWPSLQIFELVKTYRYTDRDALSHFVKMLTLQCESTIINNMTDDNTYMPSVYPKRLSTQHLIIDIYRVLPLSLIQAFYHLLQATHYRTHPLDIRRLFDGEQQFFLCAYQNQKLIGGIWVQEEGQLSSELNRTIILNQRRPPGNLSVQLLAAQSCADRVCELKVWRISRIAIQTSLQRQNHGSQLLQQLKKMAQDDAIDAMSVSFGFEIELCLFWQKNGFQLVHITPQRDHVSGQHTVLMWHGISQEGLQQQNRLSKYFDKNQYTLSQYKEFNPTLRHYLSITLPNSMPYDFDQLDYQQLYLFSQSARQLDCHFALIARFIHHCQQHSRHSHWLKLLPVTLNWLQHKQHGQPLTVQGKKHITQLIKAELALICSQI